MVRWLRTVAWLVPMVAVCGPALAAPRPPRIMYLRPEDGKALLAIEPGVGRPDYRVRVRHANGRQERLVEHVEVDRYAIHGLQNGADYRVSVARRGGPWSPERQVRPAQEPPWSWLRQAFAGPNPTRNSNPFTMVHGNETEAELRAILRAAYHGGFEGITIHPYNYADFLGPGQWSRWRILVDEARRLGLCLWQQDDRNYPSGSADGRITRAHPEFGRWLLAPPMETTVIGPRRQHLAISEMVTQGEQLVAVSAYPVLGQEPIDLTDQVRAGALDWQVPQGQWRVYVVKAIRDGRPYIDFMNPRAVDAYLAAIYDATYRQLGSEFGRTWRGFFTDEAPVDTLQYSADLPQRFQRNYGYSPRRWLPALWHDMGPGTMRIRTDYRDFVREQNAAVFFGRSREWCRRHSVSFIGHVIEDHQQDYRRLEFLDMPGFDHIFDQWYRPDPDVYWRQSKMTSSIAHYNGSRADLALVEHFAATGWQTGLSEMKRMMDWTTAMGLNQVVPCGLDTQDPPVWEDKPEFWLHGKNPQWSYFPAYQATANRMTMLMRGGRHIAPVLVLDNTESGWVGTTRDMAWTNEALSRAQVDYDNLPYRVFTDRRRTVISGGLVRVGHEGYRAVVLPAVGLVPPEVLERLLEFRAAGAVVVVLGDAPMASCRGDQDARVQAAASRLWGSPGRAGAALVSSEPQVSALLRSRGVWDIRLAATPGVENVLACHRVLGGRHVLFVANTSMTPVATRLEIRGVRGAAENWDPVSGAITDPQGCAVTPNGMQVPLQLGEAESRFIVVDPTLPMASRREEARVPAVAIRTAGRWRELPDRAPFSRSLEAAILRPAGATPELELQGASEVITVSLNGRTVGTRFCAPYRFTLAGPWRAGRNLLKVRQIERWQYTARPPTVDDPDLTYSPGWQVDAYAPAWLKTRHYTDRPGASAEYRFTGTAVSWVGERNDDRGLAEIRLDGTLVAVVDTYCSGVEIQRAELWRSVRLQPGAHSLRITCLGRSGNRASRGAYISVDGLAVETDGPPLPWRRAVITGRP